MPVVGLIDSRSGGCLLSKRPRVFAFSDRRATIRCHDVLRFVFVTRLLVGYGTVDHRKLKLYLGMNIPNL